jgi:nucleoside-diphosphate-sugar epimerase
VTFRDLGSAIAAALGVPPPWISIPRWAVMPAATALEIFARSIGQKPPLGRSGVNFFSTDRVFSCEKANQGLGYAPTYDLATGVTKTVAGYRAQGWL